MRAVLWLLLLVQVLAAQRPDVLVVLMDDVGVGLLESTPTPVLDSLAADGASFRVCYASPTCSPTRASALTGQWPHYTGVGSAIPHSLDSTETGEWYPGRQGEALPALLRAAGYRTAAIGKWHLVDDSPSLACQQMHPFGWGFDEHHGPIAGGLFPSQGWSYALWDQSDAVVGGAATWNTVSGYATTRQVDDALAFMGASERPWFVWMSFNAPHTPAHFPPQGLLTTQPPHQIDTAYQIGLALEALDTELGRLLAAVDEDAWVIVMGDNGSHAAVTGDPDNAKGSILEGGVSVPLIVRGPGVVDGSEPVTPAAAADLWATVLAAVNVPAPTGHASRSLLRAMASPDVMDWPWTFAEKFEPNGPGPRTEHLTVARAQGWALVRDELAGTVDLYDVLADPSQSAPIAQPWNATQQAAADYLGSVIDAELAP